MQTTREALPDQVAAIPGVTSYRLRYKVERSFAWLGNFRRLLICWERLFAVYRSWFTVAVMVLSLRRCSALP